MGSRDPEDVQTDEEDLAKITIGTPERLKGRIEITDYNLEWRGGVAERTGLGAALGPI